MSVVDLSDAEWAQVMAILSTAPWRDANPLLMKIGGQLQAQAVPKTGPFTAADTGRTNASAIKLDTNGKEAAS